MLAGNRGLIALWHQRDERNAAYIAVTEGWYATIHWMVTPDWCFLPDVDFHREVAELHDDVDRRAREPYLIDG